MPPADRPPKLDPGKQVSVKWEHVDDVPVMACNVFLAQHTNQEFVLSFGFATPPVFLKAPTQEEMDAIQSIQANVVARIGLSPGRMVELIQILQQNLQTYQESQMRH